MYELERKARADHRAIRERLRDLDLTPTAEVVQEDTYMNHPGRDFAETDEALRIRRQHPVDEPAAATVELTYKGPRIAEDAKTRIERTTTAGDRDELYAILTALGFEDVDAVVKRRTRYEYTGVIICLDEVEGLGEYVELEAASTSNSLDPAAQRIQDVWSELEMEDHESITTPYLTMLLDERADTGSAVGEDPGRGSRSR